MPVKAFSACIVVQHKGVFTAHELIWLTQLHDAYIGHARKRHDSTLKLTVCSKTRTVGAQSVLDTFSNAAVHTGIQFNSVHMLRTSLYDSSSISVIFSYHTRLFCYQNKAVMDRKLHPGAAIRGVTLSVRHFRVTKTRRDIVQTWCHEYSTHGLVGQDHGVRKVGPWVWVHWPATGIPTLRLQHSQVQGCMWAVLWSAGRPRWTALAYAQVWRHPWNRKYITYHDATPPEEDRAMRIGNIHK